MSDLSIEEAAVLYIESIQIGARLEELGIDTMPDKQSVPRWSVRCGEAYMLIPAVARLILIVYPQLADPDVLETVLRDARTQDVNGAAN